MSAFWRYLVSIKELKLGSPKLIRYEGSRGSSWSRFRAMKLGMVRSSKSVAPAMVEPPNIQKILSCPFSA